MIKTGYLAQFSQNNDKRVASDKKMAKIHIPISNLLIRMLHDLFESLPSMQKRYRAKKTT